MKKSRFHIPLKVVSTFSLALLTACNDGYTVPAGGANLRAFGLERHPPDATEFTDAGAGKVLEPSAAFPALIAVVRLQEARGHWRDHGDRYAVETVRDVELDQSFRTFAQYPMIRGLVPLNRLTVNDTVRGDRELREAARALGADMLLVYTIDSDGEVDHHVPELSVVTLGLFPEGQARATCTASAILLDARTGYVYAVAEGSDLQKRLASAWGGESAANKARRRAEKNAFNQLLQNLGERWNEVVAQYADAP